MRVREIVELLEAWAPPAHAESWDNVGLLAGDADAAVNRVVVTIDVTRAVLDEAIGSRAELIVAYHPPIFAGLKKLTRGGLAYDAIKSGVALYSPHTALDVADGGTNDMLADVVAMRSRAPLRPAAQKDAGYKLVTFVPAEARDAVSRALFEAGAGEIGRYTSCSFASAGKGTFFGGEGAQPVVGEAGRLEEVDELRLETVVPIARVDDVVRALRAAHPYEEPAFDLVRLAPALGPSGAPAPGMGRIGPIDPVDRGELIDRVKRGLGVERVLVAGPIHGVARRVAVCAGSCGDFYKDALAKGADVYVTGELRHHDALAAAERGMTVVCALHSGSERPVLRRIVDRIAAAFPGVAIDVSRKDRDPFAFA